MKEKDNHDTIGAEEFSPKNISWQGITLTLSAAKQLQRLSNQGKHVHLSVKASGCTGYAYVLNLIESPTDDDLIFESNGAHLYVSLTAMPFLDGTEMDYEHQGLNQSFTYKNPNIKSQCGCGESFGV